MAKSKKGSNFERDMARKLSLWWTNGESKDVFWRTSQSGGRATQAMKSENQIPNSAGDLGYLDEIGKPFIDHFLIELKRGYSDLNILDFVEEGKKNKIQEWLVKADKERADCGRPDFILIFRRDRKKSLIVLRYTLLSDLEGYCGEFHNTFIQVDIVDALESFFIIKLDNFLEWCTGSNMKQYIKDQK